MSDQPAICQRIEAIARRNDVRLEAVPLDGVDGLPSVDLLRTAKQLRCRPHQLVLPHTVRIETPPSSTGIEWRWLEDVLERAIDLDGVSRWFVQTLIEEIEERVQDEVRDLYQVGLISFSRARELLGDLGADQAREVVGCYSAEDE